MFLRRTAIAAALIAAPLAFAAPAWAGPSSQFGCSAPCTWESVWPGGEASGPWENAASNKWEELTANQPWEKVWPGKGQAGAWEKAQNGSWEKAFGPAE
jgi:hypothetical protein